MSDNKYYVVEARFPVGPITEVDSPQEAARIGARRIMDDTGIDISNWFIRVFEYNGEKDTIGVIKEYFSNPSGSKFRDKDGNIEIHLELLKKKEEESEA